MNLTKTHRKHIAQLVMQDTPRRHKLDIQDRSVPAIANVMAALSILGWPGDESSAA